MKNKLTITNEILTSLSCYHIGSFGPPLIQDTSVHCSPKIELEEYSRVNNSVLFSIGAFSYCASRHPSLVSIKIGRFCSIASGFNIMGGDSHPIEALSTSPYSYGPWYKNYLPQNVRYEGPMPAVEKLKKSTIIGHDVWIGLNVTVKAGCKIGNGAVVAANSYVVKDVPPYAIVGGNPAKFIRWRFDAETISELIQLSFWELDPQSLSKIDFSNVHLAIDALKEVHTSNYQYKRLVLAPNSGNL